SATAGTLHLAAPGARDATRDRAARASAVVPEPPRLCAADAVPRLWPPLRLYHLRRLAGRSPFSPASGLPSLRLLDAAPAYLPELRSGGVARRRRSRCRTAAGRGGLPVSGCAHHGAVERSDHLDRDDAQRVERD